MGEANKHYICSRFYRAPELLCKSQRYNCSVDLWSVGCCLAEMMLGRPLFNGVNTRHQLSLIAAVLGDVPHNYPSRSKTRYSTCKGQGMTSVARWKFVLQYTHSDVAALEFLRSVLQYNPAKRPSLKQTLAHDFFNPIVRQTGSCTSPYPPLEWTQHEKK